MFFRHDVESQPNVAQERSLSGAIMNTALTHLQILVEQGSWGYHPTGPHPTGPKSAEPVAFACLALSANELGTESLPLAHWLAEIQSPAGSVGVTQDQDTPAWPTSLAILAWQACDHANANTRFAAAKQQALNWALQNEGEAAPQPDDVGHDTTLLGWSWAAATHSWLEPTCMFVLALKAMGQSEHPRTREGVRLIVDRLLESGGCNYGNTRVLGQATLPHVQSTGLAMLAIADESAIDSRIERALDYLNSEINTKTATASLSFALLGLTAHNRRPVNAAQLIDHALTRELQNGPSCYKLALLSLASLSDVSWLPQPTFLATESVPNI